MSYTCFARVIIKSTKLALLVSNFYNTTSRSGVIFNKYNKQVDNYTYYRTSVL